LIDGQTRACVSTQPTPISPPVLPACVDLALSDSELFGVMIEDVLVFPAPAGMNQLSVVRGQGVFPVPTWMNHKLKTALWQLKSVPRTRRDEP